MENNELKLSTKKNLTHINHIGIGTIRIYLPKEAKLGEVSLDIGAGTLYVEDVCTESFSVDVGAGEAEIDHFSAAKVDLNCDTGSLTARGSADLDMVLVRFSTLQRGKKMNLIMILNVALEKLFAVKTVILVCQ